MKSIPLKEGESSFVEKAFLLRKHGAAVVVMAFGEVGQASTEEDKVRFCKREHGS